MSTLISGLKVAIKVVWKNFNSAENEARILENLRHPCIIDVVEGIIHKPHGQNFGYF